MMDRIPLRIRLTLWYSLVFGAALISIGAASLWMVHRAIDDLEREELQQRVRSVRRLLEARPAGENPATLRDAITSYYDASHGTKWLQVIDSNGNWLYRSPHVAAVYPRLALPGDATKAGVYFTYTTDSIRVRGLIEPISVHGARYTVQTGLTLDRALAILSNFGLQLSILTGCGLLLSAFAGYLMSRKALIPIAAIAYEAQRINDRNLNLRMPELQTRDELAALSSTLNQMLRRIEDGYQSVRSFTANAAHELRTPVALLRAEVEVALAFSRNSDYYRNTCRHVLNHSVQMARTIDQLLALTRADAGIQPLRFEPCNLPDLIETAAAHWVHRFEDAKIEFTVDSDLTTFWVHSDHPAVTRLLNILLENAWRYTPSGRSVVLSLRSLPRGAESALAEIAVTDTGIGISAKEQARVFERFYRAARPLHGDFAGSGLGLVLAQWIAECHRTTINLQSSPGEGSRFFFVMAAIQPPDPQTHHEDPTTLHTI